MRGLIAIAALAALLAAIAAVALADTHEGVGGITYVEDSAPTHGVGTATVVKAVCPDGKHVIGGGLANENESAAPMDSAPFDGNDANSKPDDGWRARFGSEGGGPDAGHVFAICGARKLHYRTAGVTHASKVKTSPTRVARAKCGGKTHVVGGGVKFPASETFGDLLGSHPFDSKDDGKAPDDGWEARAPKSSGKMRAFAICQKAKPGYHQAHRSVEQLVQEHHSVSCPKSAHLIGVGANIGGPDSSVDAISPGDGKDADHVPDDATRVTAGHSIGGPDKVRLTAYAICQA